MKTIINFLVQKKQYLKVVFIITLCCITIFSSLVLTGNLKSNNTAYNNVVQTKILQAKLQGLGYYENSINGKFDKATVKALKQYQKDVGLDQTGVLDDSTMCAVGVSNNAQQNNNLYLLAKLIHSEARGEVYTGQVAVGAVVLNRVDSADFPNTLEGVIYQPWAFTALHDGQFDLEPTSESYQAAEDALSGWDPTYGCLYYYNPRTATSKWIFSREIVVEIGNHVFCY